MSDDYLAKNLLKVAPGSMSGTLAKDMGNQGPVLSKPAPSMNLADNMKMANAGPAKKSPPPVAAPLRTLMRQ